MIVVEPHADDAFLSMGGIMEREIKLGRPVTIMTVYSATRKRGEDAKAYATAIGAAWIGLGFIEMGNAKENGPSPIDLAKVETRLIFGEQYVLPLAVTHPEHIEVRKVFEGTYTLTEIPYWYYVDQPYASKLKNQDLVQDAVEGRKIVGIYRPGALKYRHTKLFKDQSKFFHFNPPTDLEMKGYELVIE